jgi:hypothetical protein
MEMTLTDVELGIGGGGNSSSVTFWIMIAGVGPSKD